SGAATPSTCMLSLHDALPIFEQHQGALCAQVAQVDVGTAGLLVGGQRRGTAECRAAHCGHVLQDVFDGAEALALDVLAGNHEDRSEEHTSELQSRENLVCRLL